MQSTSSPVPYSSFISHCAAADLLSSNGDKPSADMDQLAISFSRLHSALDKVDHYVDDVVVGFRFSASVKQLALRRWACSLLCLLQSGRRKGDPVTGRFLADTVTSVPRISPEELERLVADNAQDALLILYLANLVRTQLALADRLGTAALPLL